jgi:hypothetical protein
VTFVAGAFRAPCFDDPTAADPEPVVVAVPPLAASSSPRRNFHHTTSARRRTRTAPMATFLRTRAS